MNELLKKIFNKEQNNKLVPLTAKQVEMLTVIRIFVETEIDKKCKKCEIKKFFNIDMEN